MISSVNYAKPKYFRVTVNKASHVFLRLFLYVFTFTILFSLNLLLENRKKLANFHAHSSHLISQYDEVLSTATHVENNAPLSSAWYSPNFLEKPAKNGVIHHQLTFSEASKLLSFSPSTSSPSQENNIGSHSSQILLQKKKQSQAYVERQARASLEYEALNKPFNREGANDVRNNENDESFSISSKAPRTDLVTSAVAAASSHGKSIDQIDASQFISKKHNSPKSILRAILKAPINLKSLKYPRRYSLPKQSDLSSLSYAETLHYGSSSISQHPPDEHHDIDQHYSLDRQDLDMPHGNTTKIHDIRNERVSHAESLPSTMFHQFPYEPMDVLENKFRQAYERMTSIEENQALDTHHRLAHRLLSALHLQATFGNCDGTSGAYEILSDPDRVVEQTPKAIHLDHPEEDQKESPHKQKSAAVISKRRRRILLTRLNSHEPDLHLHSHDLIGHQNIQTSIFNAVKTEEKRNYKIYSSRSQLFPQSTIAASATAANISRRKLLERDYDDGNSQQEELFKSDQEIEAENAKLDLNIDTDSFLFGAWCILKKLNKYDAMKEYIRRESIVRNEITDELENFDAPVPDDQHVAKSEKTAEEELLVSFTSTNVSDEELNNLLLVERKLQKLEEKNILDESEVRFLRSTALQAYLGNCDEPFEFRTQEITLPEDNAPLRGSWCMLKNVNRFVVHGYISNWDIILSQYIID